MYNNYYEHERENDEEFCVILDDAYTGFKEHYHDNLEVLFLLQGELVATINGKEYALQSGMISVADSYDVHGYKTKTNDAKVFIIIIPYRYLFKFNHLKKGQEIAVPVIRDEEFTKTFSELLAKFVQGEGWSKEASVDFFLSVLLSKLPLEKKDSKTECILLKKILHLIHQDFREKITLKSVSQKLGYAQEYVSRTFHHYIKKSMPQYVNELRFKEMERLYAEGEKSMLDCIFEAGFQSIQTYYRYKKTTTNKNRGCE